MLDHLEALQGGTPPSIGEALQDARRAYREALERYHNSPWMMGDVWRMRVAAARERLENLEALERGE